MLPAAKMHRMEPIFNTLKDCFRLRHRWFASFYFVCRLLVFCFAIWIKFEVDRSYMLAVLCIMFFLVFASVQPYRSKTYNVWDMIQLANLVILCVTSLLLQTPFAIRVKSQRKALTGIKICIYIPLVILILRIIWFLAIHKIKKIPWCKYFLYLIRDSFVQKWCDKVIKKFIWRNILSKQELLLTEWFINLTWKNILGLDKIFENIPLKYKGDGWT